MLQKWSPAGYSGDRCWDCWDIKTIRERNYDSCPLALFLGSPSLCLILPYFLCFFHPASSQEEIPLLAFDFCSAITKTRKELDYHNITLYNQMCTSAPIRCSRRRKCTCFKTSKKKLVKKRLITEKYLKHDHCNLPF